MARPKKYESAGRVEEIARLYLKSWTQAEIARHIGVTRPAVYQALKGIRKELAACWQGVPREHRLAVELEKIDRLERIALDAYERSCGIQRTRGVEAEYQQRTPRKQDGTPYGKEEVRPSPVSVLVGKRVKTGRQQRTAGDPAFLARVAWCIEQRCKLLGLVEVAGTTVNVTTPKVTINWAEMYDRPPLPADPVEERIRALTGHITGDSPGGKGQ